MSRILSSQHRLAIGMSLLVVVCFVGCGKPSIGPTAYSVAITLDNVFERRDRDQLERAAGLIQTMLATGEISSEESQLLSDLVTLAQADQWDDARLKIRRLLGDQTKPAM
jgi:hypothetical protein